MLKDHSIFKKMSDNSSDMEQGFSNFNMNPLKIRDYFCHLNVK